MTSVIWDREGWARIVLLVFLYFSDMESGEMVRSQKDDSAESLVSVNIPSVNPSSGVDTQV